MAILPDMSSRDAQARQRFARFPGNIAEIAAVMAAMAARIVSHDGVICLTFTA
jgi:hypothetical protein